jgi:hypothetical protein
MPSILLCFDVVFVFVVVFVVVVSRQSQFQVDILNDFNHNVNAAIPEVIERLKNSSTDPQNIAKALELVSLVKAQLPLQSQLATEAKRAAREIADLNDRQKLDMSAGEVQRNLQELVAAANLVSDIAGLSEVEKVMCGFDLIKAQLEQLRYRFLPFFFFPFLSFSLLLSVSMLLAHS